MIVSGVPGGFQILQFRLLAGQKGVDPSIMTAMDVSHVATSLPMRYFLRIPNFGDLLNPLLISSLFGRDPYWVAEADRDHMLAIGSIMAAASPQSHIWGAGVMHPDFGIGQADPAHIHALRGPKSFMALHEAGMRLPDIPLGDPAILAPRAFNIEVAQAPRHRIGLVAHYVDRANPAVLRLLAQEGVADINVHRDPLAMIAAMADCSVIVSSSLHGLIVAEALGLPSLWCQASDGIAGGLFKFHDWFAMTRNPQIAPHMLNSTDRVEALEAMAEQRCHMIDMDALIGAFPSTLHGTTDCFTGVAKGEQRKSVAECRSAPMPVFLISFNRGATLRKVVDGLRVLPTSLTIVIHDNGSFDEKTIEILREMEDEGITVYRYGCIENADQLNQVNESVERYFSDWAEPVAYVVSDCDVDISVASDDAIEIYKSLLCHFRKAECVGPMLRIRDIPHVYPLRNRALNRHIEQFWKHEPTLMAFDGRPVAYQEALIDTTFAVHRAGEPFRRLKMGIRLYEPFEALHLDWYCENISTEDQVYATTSHGAISHWNNAAETEIHEAAELEFDHFLYVDEDGMGGLHIVKGYI
jgi:hypothetical protein